MNSKKASKDRLLIHGPCLQDLTDLLFFDKIVYPTTMAFERPRSLLPGYVGYPVKEPLSQGLRDKLAEAGLILNPGEVIMGSLAGDFAAQLSQGAEAFLQWTQQSAEEIGKVMGEISSSSLDTPANGGEVAAWFRDIDAKTKKFADLAVMQGQRAVPKYYLDHLNWTLKPGWTLVLSITFLKFPFISTGQVRIEELISFLSDVDTKSRRQALFDWLIKMEVEAWKGQFSIDHIPQQIAQLLAHYSRWILKSKLPSHSGIAEFLLIFSSPFIEQLLEIPLTKEVNNMLALGPRGLSFTEKDIALSGRELAYLSHGKRGYAE